MTANEPNEPRTEESLASEKPGAAEPLPNNSPHRNESGAGADYPDGLDLDPHPGDIEPEDHIDRPLSRFDHPHQMTKWDRNHNPQTEPPEHPTNAREISHINPKPDLPEIDEPGCLADYRKYNCISCQGEAIEPEESPHAQQNECRTCYLLPSL